MSESPRPTDDQLREWIDGARSGSMECLGQIAATYRNYLLLIANQDVDANMRGKVGASDIVQETFMQAQLKFDQFRGNGEEELLGWLRQILHNRLIDARRRYKKAEKRQLSREQRLVIRDDSKGADVVLEGDDRSPRADLIVREESEALTRAMKKLSDQHREVIILRSWERLSFAEIGEKMGRSAEAAGKLWVRAIEKLQQLLESADDE